MANTYTALHYHLVFSTKRRERWISPDIETRIWQFLGGIARENRMKALCIGGVEDHVHILVSLCATLSVSEAVQRLKGGSSKWVHDTFPEHRSFSWQAGYGAFSVSVSQMKTVVDYINTQAEHHRHKTFQEEFLALLKKHEIDYDERYLWD